MRDNNPVSDVSESITKELTELLKKSPIAYNQEGLARIKSVINKHVIPCDDIEVEYEFDEDTYTMTINANITVYVEPGQLEE